MLTQIKHTLSDLLLGEPVAETEEIYRTNDERFQIHLGLFRKPTGETVWLKFVRPSFLTRSSSGIGIAVDTFQGFADFLGEAFEKAQHGAGEPRPMPFFARMVLRMTEGVSGATLLGEYRSPQESKISTRLFSFSNRQQQRRVVFWHKSPSQDTYEAFDLEVLSRLEHEIRNRQRRPRGRSPQASTIHHHPKSHLP